VIKQGGQVLAFFALVLPIILVPVVAYAVDAATLSSRAASLQAAAAQAAEVAVQQIDPSTLRSSGRLTVDAPGAEAAASEVLRAEEPGATLDHLAIDAAANELTVVASEPVGLPIYWQARSVVMHASAAARLVPGYANPSSRLPLPTSTF
jgi:hypothetical protein